MVANELGGIGLPSRSAGEEDGGRRGGASHLVHLDFGHVLGVIDRNVLGGQVFKSGTISEHCSYAHIVEDLKKIQQISKTQLIKLNY